jgi:hypothetical protein
MATDPQPLVTPNGRPAGGGRRRSGSWVWFFVAVIVLTIIAIALLWFFNVKQQLTFEQLQAARQRWDQNRPTDYDLTWTKTGSAAGMVFNDSFLVRVRHGEVQSVLMRQEVPDNGTAKRVERKLPERFYDRYDMGGLFADLKGFLKAKADQAGRGRVSLTARFDPGDGHVEGYIYINPQNSQRIKVMVELERRPASGKPSR